MKNIHLQCILDLLKKHGFEPIYTDTFEIDSVTYHFVEPKWLTLRFVKTCVPSDVTYRLLLKFSLQKFNHELSDKKCDCNW